MNFLDTIFGPGSSGLRAFFKFGYIPEVSEFFELTEAQYQKYRATCGETKEKVYMLLPKDPAKYSELASGDVFTLFESELESVKDALFAIDFVCKQRKKVFKNDHEKLKYLASFMPAPLSSDTPYAEYAPTEEMEKGNTIKIKITEFKQDKDNGMKQTDTRVIDYNFGRKVTEKEKYKPVMKIIK